MAEFTPRGQGNLNTVLGAIGTAGTLMPNLFGGILNNGCYDSNNMPVSRYELGLIQENTAIQNENSILKAEIYSDGKLVEAYRDLQGQIKELRGIVDSNKDAQQAINLQQAVYNGTNTATINCIQNQVNQLLGLTKLVVPNTSVCPGWGNVTITPAAATTTPAA